MPYRHSPACGQRLQGKRLAALMPRAQAAKLYHLGIRRNVLDLLLPEAGAY